jgi:cytochrome P450
LDLGADVHATFARYRKSFAFIAMDTGGYVVLRHDDVVRLMNDPRLQATEVAMPVQAGVTAGVLHDIFAHGMLTANGEVHARRRSAVSRALATQVLDEFRRHLRQAATDLIDASYAAGRLELASGFAAKLPILALANLLDIPRADIPVFSQDVDAMNAFFRPKPSEDAVADAETAAQRVRTYLDALLTNTGAKQSQGFVAQYLRSVEEADLSRSEALMQIIQLIIGGTESVRMGLIAQTVQLLSQPEQWRAVCEDPTLVPNAVTEAMRLEPGIAGVVRVSVDDIELDGWVLPAGQLVLLSAISALRDERVFDRPNVFDMSRPKLSLARMAFGGGAHACVAEAMGRAELEEGLSALTERLPSLQLENIPAFQGHMFVRKTGECWVRWRL